MFTNKKLIRFGLSLFVFLGIINFTISYFQTYLETAADIKWVIPEIWKTILLDVPQGILVLLGAIALYDFTKRHHKKTHQSKCVFLINNFIESFAGDIE